MQGRNFMAFIGGGGGRAVIHRGPMKGCGLF